MTTMGPDTGWHLTDDDLGGYAAGRAAPAQRWSVEAHLARCASCRARLAGRTAPHVVDAGWERIDAELDAPVPGLVERLLARLGVPEHTARLLAATPALRTSWLAALASTVVLAAVLANVANPAVFLATMPLLPLLGVAVSFGPRVDPTFELTVVAPVDTFRLLLLRSSAVLGVTTTASALSSLAMPRYGPQALGWFLPALALTLLTLTLLPRLGAVPAAGVVGLGWLAVVMSLGTGAVVTTAGQAAVAVTAVCAGVVLVLIRSVFDTPRISDHAPGTGVGRVS